MRAARIPASSVGHASCVKSRVQNVFSIDRAESPKMPTSSGSANTRYRRFRIAAFAMASFGNCICQKRMETKSTISSRAMPRSRSY